MTRQAVQGFSLIELMVVVLIIGILSSIAIPTFRTYMYKARTSEATAFLGDIRQRQEAYRSEFGQYCAVSGNTWGTYMPATIPGKQRVAWPGSDAWRQLGASPDNAVYFQYATIAGPPATTPPGGLGYDGSDFWSVSRAQGDLDGDGTTVIFESYSSSSNIWISNPQGWE